MIAIDGQAERFTDKLLKQFFFAQALHGGTVLGQVQHQTLAVGGQAAGH